MKLKNLHFQQVLRWHWCCWLREQTLRISMWAYENLPAVIYLTNQRYLLRRPHMNYTLRIPLYSSDGFPFLMHFLPGKGWGQELKKGLPIVTLNLLCLASFHKGKHYDEILKTGLSLFGQHGGKVKSKWSRAMWTQSTSLQTTSFVLSNKLHILPVSQFLLKLCRLKIPIKCLEQNLPHGNIM